jgi:Ca2+-binding RTX toxin-like protein
MVISSIERMLLTLLKSSVSTPSSKSCETIDTINSGAGDDYIVAGDGNDIINAGGGDDIIYGGTGNDTINAGSGKDTIYLEGDLDVISGGSDA